MWELYSFMRRTSIVRNLHTFCSSLVLVPLKKLWLPPEKLTSQRSATGCEGLLIVPQTPPGQQSIQVKALCFFKTFFNHLEMTTEVPFNDTLRPAPPILSLAVTLLLGQHVRGTNSPVGNSQVMRLMLCLHVCVCVCVCVCVFI